MPPTPRQGTIRGLLGRVSSRLSRATHVVRDAQAGSVGRGIAALGGRLLGRLSSRSAGDGPDAAPGTELARRETSRLEGIVKGVEAVYHRLPPVLQAQLRRDVAGLEAKVGRITSDAIQRIDAGPRVGGDPDEIAHHLREDIDKVVGAVIPQLPGQPSLFSSLVDEAPNPVLDGLAELAERESADHPAASEASGPRPVDDQPSLPVAPDLPRAQAVDEGSDILSIESIAEGLHADEPWALPEPDDGPVTLSVVAERTDRPSDADSLELADLDTAPDPAGDAIAEPDDVEQFAELVDEVDEPGDVPTATAGGRVDEAPDQPVLGNVHPRPDQPDFPDL